MASPLSWVRDCCAWYKLRQDVKGLRSSVHHKLVSDDDILSSEEKDALRFVESELSQLSGTLTEKRNKLNNLIEVFGGIENLSGFTHWMRGTLDVIVVALCVAFGVRALFLQPFQIPTSSMQPTLFGIHYIDEKQAAPYTGSMTKLFRPFGASRARLISPADRSFFTGQFQVFSRPFAASLPLLFYRPGDFYLTATQVGFGGGKYVLPGSDATNNILRYLDNVPNGNTLYQKDEPVVDGWLSSGDHLFVDRVSIHFSKLKRGDVFVFNTENLKANGMPLTGYYYIKRLAGLPGDTLKISGNTLFIRPKDAPEFKPVYEWSDAFRKVYSGQGGYQGHIPAGILPENVEYTVPENHYFALGDNTANSLDSRFWGAVPAANIIGRGAFVFWPVSRRVGPVDFRDPVPVKTFTPDGTTQPAQMKLQ